MSIAAILLAACSGNQKKEHDHNDGTHQHADGSTHQNHKADTVKQEEFTATSDTSLNKTEKEHSHEGHEHSH